MKTWPGLLFVLVVGLGAGPEKTTDRGQPAVIAEASPPEPPPGATPGLPFPGLVAAQRATALGVVKNGPEFTITTHKDLSKVANHACTKLLGEAQWNEDILHVWDSRPHFDNCAFDEALAYQAERLADIAAAVTEYRKSTDPKQLDRAISAAGRILHGLQDFYSHTNFLEITPPPTAKQDSPILKLWERAGQQSLALMRKNGLVSGLVWWERFDRRCGGATWKGTEWTHAMLSKDSPKTPMGGVKYRWSGRKKTGNEIATDLARDTSISFLSYVFNEWPELVGHCGSTIGFGLSLDGRQIPDTPRPRR